MCLVLTKINDDVIKVITEALHNSRTVTVCLPLDQQEVELPTGISAWYYDQGSIENGRPSSEGPWASPVA